MTTPLHATGPRAAARWSNKPASALLAPPETARVPRAEVRHGGPRAIPRSLSLPAPQHIRAAATHIPPRLPPVSGRTRAEAVVQALRAAEDRETRSRLLDALAALADTDSMSVREALRYKFPAPRHALSAMHKVLEQGLGAEAARCLFNDLFHLAWQMRCAGKDRIVIVNATFCGGGVAELFQTCAEIFQHLRVDVEWHTTLASDARFNEVGRKAFDVLQGSNRAFTDEDFAVWAEENARLGRILQGVATDPRVGGVFLEDHHPVHLIEHFQNIRRAAGIDTPLKIIWRSHVDNANLLAKGSAPMELWQRVIKPQLMRLTPCDVALFQPGSVPDDVQRLPCGVFTQPPGTNPLALKMQPVSDEQMWEILARVAPGVRRDRPYLVTGGRYVGWKGLLPLMRAHARVMQEFPDIDHLVFGTLGSGDPRKTAYFAQVQAFARQFDKAHPDQAGRFQVVRDKCDEIRAFYALAARWQTFFCQMSIAEGFGNMAAEAAYQHAVPLVTRQGGLGRFGEDADLAAFTVDIADLAARIGDPADLYELDDDGQVVSRSPLADALEERYADLLRTWFRRRATDPAGYAAAYASAEQATYRMTQESCNWAMWRAYLSMCMATPNQLRDAKADRDDKPAAPSKTLVEHVRQRAFGGPAQ